MQVLAMAELAAVSLSLGALRASTEHGALVPAAPSGRPSRELVWWLHIPKCGMSFKASAELYAEDPEHSKACCGYTHKRVPAGASDETLSHVVAMFRDPKQRAASAYYYMKKKSAPDGINRCCERDWGWQKTVYRPIRARIRDDASFSATLADFKGCQANMVLGHGCMERPDSWIQGGNWTNTAQSAIWRMRKFRFVGIESEWLLSICLFNFKMTGRRYVTRSQVVDSHATHKVRGKEVDLYNQTYTEYDVESYPEDPLDGPLYRAVETRFWQEVKSNGISQRHCPEESANAAVSLQRTATPTEERPHTLPGWMGEDSWVDEEAVRKWNIPLVHRRREPDDQRDASSDETRH